MLETSHGKYGSVKPEAWAVGITAGSREVPGRKGLWRDDNTNNNNNNKIYVYHRADSRTQVPTMKPAQEHKYNTKTKQMP